MWIEIRQEMVGFRDSGDFGSGVSWSICEQSALCIIDNKKFNFIEFLVLFLLLFQILPA